MKCQFQWINFDVGFLVVCVYLLMTWFLAIANRPPPWIVLWVRACKPVLLSKKLLLVLVFAGINAVEVCFAFLECLDVEATAIAKVTIGDKFFFYFFEV